MGNFKIERLNEDIKRELTDILRSVKDPRVDKMLTIVKVDLSVVNWGCALICVVLRNFVSLPMIPLNIVLISQKN